MPEKLGSVVRVLTYTALDKDNNIIDSFAAFYDGNTWCVARESLGAMVSIAKYSTAREAARRADQEANELVAEYARKADAETIRLGTVRRITTKEPT